MPAPATNQELLSLIARSRVRDADRVREYLAKLTAAGGVPAAPPALAARMVADGFLSPFQAENLLAGRWKRFFIGKYKVLERIGVGGMGAVFLCEHTLMKRKVAVKVLPAAKAKDPAARQRFYREARAVAAVDHPNIVRAYDIDDDDGLHFLVMEYVDGASLYDLVARSGPLPVGRACHYVYGTCVGLQHAHECGLIHRDIKPANVLVDRAGVVKILDLGLARFFSPAADDKLTQQFDETVLGTADYLAPEQAIDSSAVDIRADIYGLGGTFYFLLAGRPPFPEGSIAQKLLWHQNTAPTPIRDLRPDVPPELAAVLDKMLAKDPAARYQTPLEVMAALEPWIRTPIPPPADHELPQSSGSSRPAPPPSSSAAESSPFLVQPSSAERPAPSVAPIPAPSVVWATTAAAAPPPAAHDPNALWESITSTDTIPTATADTANKPPAAKPVPTNDDPTPPAGGRSRVAKARATKKPSSVLPLALTLGGVLFLIAGGVGVFFLWKHLAN
jgi:serine/threonine protein kinase